MRRLNANGRPSFELVPLNAVSNAGTMLVALWLESFAFAGSTSVREHLLWPRTNGVGAHSHILKGGR